MPTTRKRHQVTETDELERALDGASEVWPGESRSQLLGRIVKAGWTAIESEIDRAAGRRHSAIDRASRAYEDVYETGYLGALREDWPA